MSLDAALGPDTHGAGVDRRRWTVLLLSAAVSLALYLMLQWVVPGLSWSVPSHAGDLFPWVGRLTREVLTPLQKAGGLELHTAASVGFLVLLGGLFAAYLVALRAAAGQRSLRLQAALFGAGATFLMIQTMAPAMLSSDLFAYVVYGRIFGLYHGDPYSEAAGLGPGDPYGELWTMAFIPSWYGPLWTLISGALARLGGEHVGLTVLLFRGVAVLAALAAGALVWGCLRRAAPHRATQGLVLFLWNPLLVLEAGLSGHNDVVMVALVMFGIWLHVGSRRSLAVTAIVLSVLVKPVSGLILPLYLLMVLRFLPGWGGRLRYLAVSGAGAAVAVAFVLVVARAGPGAWQPLLGGATGVYYYTNSINESLFAAVRQWLGEEPESIRAPLWFRGWWVATSQRADLWSAPDPSAEIIGRVEPGIELLVLAPQMSEWLWVYSPATKQKGHLHGEGVAQTERPAAADTDPVLARLEAGPAASWTVQQAHQWMRVLGWGALGAIWLAAAWHATDLRRLLVGATAVMLAAYWLVLTWFWPWYVIWALALAALVPTSWPAGLAVVLSATVLSLYAAGGYQGSAHEWIYTYRSLPAFVLPLLLWPLSRALRLVGR